MGNSLLVDEQPMDTEVVTSVTPEPDLGCVGEVAAAERRFGVHALLATACRVIKALASAAEWLFGLIALVMGLSMLAALPLVQFASLGYFLESSARVARTGRLRDGFIGVRRAARVGGLAAAIWLTLVPTWLVSSYAYSAQLIDPGGPVARNWRVALVVVTALSLLHIAASCARGGRFRDFLRPFGHPFWLYRQWHAGGAISRGAATVSGPLWPRCGCPTILDLDWSDSWVRSRG